MDDSQTMGSPELRIYKLRKAAGGCRPLPLYPGGLYCGAPGEVDLQPEWVEPGELLSDGADNVFMAVVQGDSMEDLGFRPGDMCVVNREKMPQEGSVVVVEIDGEFTMKVLHLLPKENKVVLYPANRRYDPIVIDTTERQLEVWGVVTKCIKNCSGGTTIVKAYNPRRPEAKRQVGVDTMRLRAVIDEVAPQLTAQRMWFAVYAAMADAGVVERGDFPAFEKLLAAACPEGLPRRLDVRDLRRLNVLSFAGPIGIWTERNAPVTGSTFGKYERLALQTLELLRGKG